MSLNRPKTIIFVRNLLCYLGLAVGRPIGPKGVYHLA